MILECLIMREGVTPVILGSSKVKYQFMPIPGSKKGEVTTSVCEINKEEDIRYLLSTGQYREYDPELAYKELSERRERISIKPLMGFKFEKYHDQGYIVVDFRQAKKRYGDSVGWKDDPVNLVPFKSEVEAYQWLKEEVKFLDMENEVEVEASIEGSNTKEDSEISPKGLEALDKILAKDAEGGGSKKKDHYHKIPR